MLSLGTHLLRLGTTCCRPSCLTGHSLPHAADQVAGPAILVHAVICEVEVAEFSDLVTVGFQGELHIQVDGELGEKNRNMDLPSFDRKSTNTATEASSPSSPSPRPKLRGKLRTMVFASSWAARRRDEGELGSGAKRARSAAADHQSGVGARGGMEWRAGIRWRPRAAGVRGALGTGLREKGRGDLRGDLRGARLRRPAPIDVVLFSGRGEVCFIYFPYHIKISCLEHR